MQPVLPANLTPELLSVHVDQDGTGWAPLHYISSLTGGRLLCSFSPDDSHRFVLGVGAELGGGMVWGGLARPHPKATHNVTSTKPAALGPPWPQHHPQAFQDPPFNLQDLE